RGQREDEVRRKEAELHQHRLRIVQFKNGLQVRNQDVIETGKKSPHEEEHRRDAHGPDISPLIRRPLCARGCADADCHIDTRPLLEIYERLISIASILYTFPKHRLLTATRLRSKRY